MTVFHSLSGAPADFGPSVVTIGNFDGVHAGHREILRRVAAIGRERGLTPAVLTFDPHPARVLAPERAPKLITTVGQRLRRLEAAGAEAVLLAPFSPAMAKLTPEEFARTALAGTLHTRVVIVGEDFRFGHRQAGDIGTLRALGERLGFTVEPALAVMRRGERVSSTAIRKLVEAGRVSRACRLLCEPFALEGPVVKGHGIGRRETVPTLNLEPENELLPATGVYATETRDAGETSAGRRRWRSVTNVGYRPTFGGRELSCETFLLDPFDGEAPPRIEVRFLRFLREERKFGEPALLRAQILKDAAAAARLHARLDAIPGTR